MGATEAEGSLVVRFFYPAVIAGRRAGKSDDTLMLDAFLAVYAGVSVVPLVETRIVDELERLSPLGEAVGRAGR